MPGPGSRPAPYRPRSFPWPPLGTCPPSPQLTSLNVWGTLCLNLEAPEQIPLPLSPVAAMGEGLGAAAVLLNLLKVPAWDPRQFPEALGAIPPEDRASHEPPANREAGRGSAGRRPWGPARGSERHRPWVGGSPGGLGAGPAVLSRIWGSLRSGDCPKGATLPPPCPLPSHNSLSQQTFITSERPPLVAAVPTSGDGPARLPAGFRSSCLPYSIRETLRLGTGRHPPDASLSCPQSPICKSLFLPPSCPPGSRPRCGVINVCREAPSFVTMWWLLVDNLLGLCSCHHS